MNMPMKRNKNICLSLLMLAPVYVWAQDIDTNCHRPMFKDGKTWNYQYIHYEEESEDAPPTEIRYDVSYVIDGDTLLEGKTYKKLYRLVAQTGARDFAGAWREEDLQVYTMEWQHIPLYPGEIYDLNVPGRLYDFTDSEYKFENDTKHGCSIDTIMVHNHLFRRFNFSNFMLTVSWVEGVGGRDGLLFNKYRLPPDCLCDFEYFVSCYEDDECVFTVKDFDAAPYDASTSIGNIRLDSLKGSVTDLQGRQLQDKPERGVYIQDGRKYVVK